MAIEIKGSADNADEVIRYLDTLATNLKVAFKKGITKSTMKVHGSVMNYLSGAKGSPGDYPVPIRTNHLRGALAFLPPGQSKQAGGVSFKAGEFSGVVYNSARYADVIRNGTHSSSKHGPRDYMEDGLKAFGGSARVAEYLLQEINTVTERL